MAFKNVPLPQGAVSEESVKRLIGLHEEYLIKAWIEVGHYQSVIAEAEQHVAQIDESVVAEAKAYLAKHKEMQRAGKQMKDPQNPAVAEAVKWLFNIEVVDNEQSAYHKAKLNIEFYSNVLEALKTLLK